METKNFSQRVLNVVKYFWKQRSGYGAILLVLFALGLICLLVVDITSRGEYGKVFFTCLKIVCLSGIVGGLLTLNTWISEMKYEWHNGFWERLRTILTAFPDLVCSLFAYRHYFCPQIVPLLKMFFRLWGQSDCLAFCSEL